MKELENNWEKYLKENLPAVKKGLHLKYEEREEHEIARAICLWKFSRGIDSNTERREFLRYFAVDASSFNVVKTIAMIESLPDRIWRKLLWKENMDFMSRESFLRRLTNKQKLAIRSAYDSLFGKNPAIPSCLRDGFGYRLRHLFKKESVEDLLDEEYVDYDRMQSKGAWAFNLLELDFGFSLYPNGEDDDTMITNKKWTRFLSVKEHINDFIVNQEFGMYWQLYRSARSNYVICPEKEVELKNHVCPGFWMTLFLHAMFWIVSPVIAGLCVFNMQIGFHLWEIPFLLVGAITPLWCVAAVLKIVGLIFATWIMKLFENKMSDRTKAAWKMVWKVCKIVWKVSKWIVYTMIVLGLGFLVYVFAIFTYTFASKAIPVTGILLYLLSIGSAFWYIIVIAISAPQDTMKWYSKVPKWIKTITWVIPLIAAFRALDYFAGQQIVTFIVHWSQVIGLWVWDAMQWIWGVISYAPSLTFAVIFMVVYLTLSVIMLITSITNERKFAQLQQILLYIMFFGSLVPFLCFAIYAGVSSFVQVFSILEVVPALIKIFFILLIFIGIVLVIRRIEINGFTIDRREKSRYFAKKISSSSSSQYQKVMQKALMQHKEEELNSILDFACLWFKEYRGSFVRMTTAIDDPKKLLKLGNQLSKLDNEEDWFIFMRYILLSKYDVRKAKSALAKEKKEQKLMDEKYGRIKSHMKSFFMAIWELIIWVPVNLWKLIAWCSIKVWQGVTWFFTKIWQFLCTFKDVWDLFNKRCPYISKSKYLN